MQQCLKHFICIQSRSTTRHQSCIIIITFLQRNYTQACLSLCTSGTTAASLPQWESTSTNDTGPSYTHIIPGTALSSSNTGQSLAGYSSQPRLSSNGGEQEQGRGVHIAGTCAHWLWCRRGCRRGCTPPPPPPPPPPRPVKGIILA